MAKTPIKLFTLLLMVSGAGNLYAGFVSGIEVSIDRFQDGTYHFNSDVFGTVSEFQSITLTSPLNNTYTLMLQDEGDQWGSGEQGSEVDITSEFIDGLYNFDVVYTDSTTEMVSAQLGGGFPVFPTSLALSGNTVTWDSWQNPTSFSYIEFAAYELDGPGEFFTSLSFSETSTSLPLDFLQLGSQYEMELWFLSSAFPTSHKASISTLTSDIAAVPAPAAIWLFGTGLIGLIGFSKRRKAV